MKFNEKLLMIRKKQGLSQEELGMELQVSRQTISKWEAGQSYPDFQRLVMLSDYFGMTLDELVKDIDVQDVREKNLTDEKVASIFSDIQNLKETGRKWWRIIVYGTYAFLAILAIAFVVHLFFPDLEWLWQYGHVRGH
ncbi:MAG: helix-turn-helix domain-containing protein [Lachnospiraceae bacterium]|nr:helix-turn-helix domain-containing protein [Lachnospiraceae bacterium]